VRGGWSSLLNSFSNRSRRMPPEKKKPDKVFQKSQPVRTLIFQKKLAIPVQMVYNNSKYANCRKMDD
ncbi:MAG: hypothetical protein IJ265_05125, partial [Oscillospiraceae bacterium]|nr:hypothetical protein [Oscillospiraceae bacterium]